jgi:hypothetical protein
MNKITLLLFTMFVFSFYSYGQNTCATANPIVAGTTTVPELIGGEVPLPECAANAGGTRSAGVWYSFTATVDGTVNISSDLPVNTPPANSEDTRLHVYSGTCAALTCIAGNDDIDNANFLSDASFPVTTGTTYFIAWDDRWDELGFDFVLTETECLITSAPGAVTTPTPADNAMGVAIVGTGATFSWVEDTTGDVADSFTISLGLTATADDIGVLEGATNGGGVNFGVENNTTYFWKIDAVNCFGSTSSAIWSFTTEDCNETSTPGCPTVFTPVDNEPSAQLGAGGALTFTWDDVPNATSYELLINGVSQGNRASGITFTAFPVSTAFTWSVIPSNCFGAAFGCATWNFTTSALLSVNDFDIKSIKHFYNSITKELTLKSDNGAFTNIDLYNILGQQVITKKLSQENETLNLSELTDGIYMAQVSIGANIRTIKFVVK